MCQSDLKMVFFFKINYIIEAGVSHLTLDTAHADKIFSYDKTFISLY